MRSLALSAVSCLLAAAPLTFSLAGCSVKEDRKLCPAILTVDLPPADSVVREVFIRSLRPDYSAGEMKVQLSEEESQCRLEAARSTFLVAVSNLPLEDGRWIIEEGSPCPEAYICRRKVSIRGEQARIKASLRKEFCRMKIGFTAPSEGISAKVRGRFCGSTLDGALIEGMFLSALPEDGCLCVPRQGDSSLLLDIESPGEGIVRSFAIGEYLRKAGYDWSKENLDDVSITLDYVRCEVVLSADCWSSTIPLEVLL